MTFSRLPSLCGPEDDALGHHAIAHEVPQGIRSLRAKATIMVFARTAGVLRAGPIPMDAIARLTSADQFLAASPIASERGAKPNCESASWSRAALAAITFFQLLLSRSSRKFRQMQRSEETIRAARLTLLRSDNRGEQQC